MVWNFRYMQATIKRIPTDRHVADRFYSSPHPTILSPFIGDSQELNTDREVWYNQREFTVGYVIYESNDIKE